MKTFGVALVGALAGLFAGLVAAEVIGITGMVLLHQALGVRYLPLILAPAFAALAVTLHRRASDRRGSGGSR